MVEITSWSEFTYSRNRLFDAFLLILRITKQKAILKTENIIVNDMLEVSRYYYGITTLADTRDLINTSFGSLLLLSVWIKFYLYDNDPNIMTVNSHCLWLVEALDSEDIDKVLQSSSLDFISRVIAKKKSRQFVKTDYYSTLMKKLHAITNEDHYLSNNSIY